MISDNAKREIKEAFDNLVNTANNSENRIVILESELYDQQEKTKKLEFFSQVSFLFGIGNITSMEYKAIMDMMSSPDQENHYMAKTIVEKKIADTQYHLIAISI